MLFEQTIKKIKMVKLFIVLLSLALIFKVGYIQIHRSVKRFMIKP